MRFINPIPFVRDIDRSKDFYQKRLGLKVLEDFGSFVLFETGFAIHEGSSLEETIWGKATVAEEPYGRTKSPVVFRT
ncbi:bleomycin resistance protein [Sinorhizobium meliloti CCNWSX0020]|uniref:Bleomycin resistance protein n=1 Tax=Sinorhizobium meliloti CCNWSX0020 TaxID=1107881 RepID=H0FT69_RHIML|nr:bleomycin resistance protein [Sinorhizobium meliloti CCNWSX0020]